MVTVAIGLENFDFGCLRSNSAAISHWFQTTQLLSIMLTGIYCRVGWCSPRTGRRSRQCMTVWQSRVALEGIGIHPPSSWLAGVAHLSYWAAQIVYFARCRRNNASSSAQIDTSFNRLVVGRSVGAPDVCIARSVAVEFGARLPPHRRRDGLPRMTGRLPPGCIDLVGPRHVAALSSII